MKIPTPVLTFFYKVFTGRSLPASAKEVFIILILILASIYPADISKRGHKTVLLSGAYEDTSILVVWI